MQEVGWQLKVRESIKNMCTSCVYTCYVHLVYIQQTVKHIRGSSRSEHQQFTTLERSQELNGLHMIVARQLKV